MFRYILSVLIFSLPLVRAYPAGERIPAGGRALSMGGTSAAIPEFWSVCNNQAGTAWLKQVSAGICFEDHFLLKTLMYKEFGLAWPLRAGTISLFACQSGASFYSELKAGISYARRFGKHFSAGVQLDYLRISQDRDYGNKNLVSCEIGFMYLGGKHLCIGVHILNPVPVRITRYPLEILPVTVCLGISYRFAEQFTTSVEAEKVLDNPPVFRFGGEYHFSSPMYVRLGLSTSPMSFSFGFGLEFGPLKIDVASEYHPILGFSPSGSVIYSFRNKKQTR